MEATMQVLMTYFFLIMEVSIFFVLLLRWIQAEMIRRALRRQGIKGPKPSFFFGNIPEMKRIATEEKERRRRKGNNSIVHDHWSSLFPYIDLWEKKYGPVFFYSNGNMVTLHVADLELVKEIYQCHSLDLGKPSFVRKNHGALVGAGVLSSNGKEWARQRKIIAPEFFMDKVKDMVGLMGESTTVVVRSWEAQVQQCGGVAEIRIDEDIEAISADVISKVCFGSSYSKGKTIFFKIKLLQQALTEQTSIIGIPFLRYLPTKKNRKIWGLAKEIRSSILKVVEDREIDGNKERGNDLLGTLLKKRSGDQEVPVDYDFVVDNCKNIYFAGFETTAGVAKWVLVLLASRPDWQTRVREEATKIIGDDTPTAEMLISRMPVLTMVIQETLRLYPPAPVVIRETLKEMKFKGLLIPKGTHISIPRLQLHQDPTLWDQTIDKFDPSRFEHGVAGACKYPSLYNPFGLSVRNCLGMNFALVELKVMISLILSRFVIYLSPNYRHGVVNRLVLEPEYGIDLLLRRV